MNFTGQGKEQLNRYLMFSFKSASWTFSRPVLSHVIDYFYMGYLSDGFVFLRIKRFVKPYCLLPEMCTKSGSGNFTPSIKELQIGIFENPL